MQRLPTDVGELLKALDELYPNRCPTIGMSDRQIWWDAGARSVVDHLLRLQEDSMNSRRRRTTAEEDEDVRFQS